MHVLQTCLFKYITIAAFHMVKLRLKGEVGGHPLSSHGNYIVDHGKSWKNHGIVFMNFCGNPVISLSLLMKSVVRLTEHLDMAIVVDSDIKPHTKQTNYLQVLTMYEPASAHGITI